MTSSPVLRATFIILSVTIIFYATSEAYILKYRPPYGTIYMQAVRDILKREDASFNHIPPLPVNEGEILDLNETDIKNEGNGGNRKRDYTLASLKLDKVRDIHLKIDVFEMDNELPPVNVNK